MPAPPPTTRAVPDRPRVVVVGAGASGLTAARALQGAYDVVVVDKGRGVGGRMATRRIGDATFDHGAQFFTTHTEDFAGTVAGWVGAGVAEPWFRSRIGPDGAADADGHVRYRGVGTMNAVAKHLALGLDVRLGTRLTSLAAADGGWFLRSEAGEVLRAHAVVLTAPVPQTLDLLAAGGIDPGALVVDALRAVRYDPCLSVLVPLRRPSGLPDPGAVAPEGGAVDWLADNQHKGVSAVPAVTVHATAGFSTEHWGSSDADVVAALLDASGLTADAVGGSVQVHRWRYAKPTVLHDDRHLAASAPAPFVCAGDAFGGAKVEGAVLSGASAAGAVAELLGR